MDSLPDFVSMWPIQLQYFVAILVLFAIIGWPLPKVVGWLRELRFSRKGWIADCPRDNSSHLDPNIAWKEGQGARWSQMRRMEVDDFYSLTIDKARIIERIEAFSEGYRIPKKYVLEVKEDKRGEWISLGEYDAPIDVLLNRPRKIAAIQFTITEPRVGPLNKDGHPPAWAIYSIRLTEVLLFGRYWRRTI